MCLDIKQWWWLRPSPETIIHAYKVFTPSVLGQLRYVNTAPRGKSCRLGQWHTAPVGNIEMVAGGRYPAGFHAFLNRIDAVAYKHELNWNTARSSALVLPVFLRGIHMKGYQDDRLIVVASQMFVPGDQYTPIPPPKTKEAGDRA